MVTLEFKIRKVIKSDGILFNNDNFKRMNNVTPVIIVGFYEKESMMKEHLCNIHSIQVHNIYTSTRFTVLLPRE